MLPALVIGAAVALLLGMLDLGATLLVVDYLAKPRASINHAV